MTEDQEELTRAKEKILIDKEAAIAGAVGGTAGVAGSIGAIAAAGTVSGLSANGITSGLAAIGSIAGGGMTAGLIITAAAPVAVGAGAYVLYKWLKSDKDSHEQESKKRYKDFQASVDQSPPLKKEDLECLNARIDAQMKLEEFLVKSREAGHPKATAWLSPAVSVAGAVVSVVSLFLR